MYESEILHKLWKTIIKDKGLERRIEALLREASINMKESGKSRAASIFTQLHKDKKLKPSSFIKLLRDVLSVLEIRLTIEIKTKHKTTAHITEWMKISNRSDTEDK